MKHLPWRETGWTILCVVFLTCLYGGVYRAMLIGDFGDWADEELPNHIVRSVRIAHYRFDGDIPRAVFRPAQLVDQVIRPSFWYVEEVRPVEVDSFDGNERGDGSP